MFLKVILMMWLVKASIQSPFYENSDTFSTLNEIHEEIFESINSHSKAIDESKKEIEKIFATFKVDENEKNFHLAKLEEQKLPAPTLIRHKRQANLTNINPCVTLAAEIAVVESSLSVAKLLVNQTAARLQSSNSTLSNLKTPIKPLILVWQLIVNLHANILKINQARMTTLQAKLDALKAQQASAGCVSTSTTTTTTTTSSYPCGTFIKYDPKTNPKIPETDGFSAGKWADGGDAYVGTVIIQNPSTPIFTVPARISTTNSSSGSGAYSSAIMGNIVSTSYLLKNPNLKWIPATNKTVERYTTVSYITSGSIIYQDNLGNMRRNVTDYDVLVCSDSTSFVFGFANKTVSTSSSAAIKNSTTSSIVPST
ncbi:hypothetical protein PVAND_016829 [Polypedilum vanderplanki]|uniref:Uncharacterized protein n=1 Tax=Polypedilum vanderplanki TaxID=319348 RepID=A0A9J6BGJ7_POLVA|nr:hypothetical protein PVAND_016829 [Polypedilum vanderplanki]